MKKESYYAALERQRAGESTLRDRLERGSDESFDTGALEALYTEMGMKAFTAFQSCLDWLGHLGRNDTIPSGERLEESLRRAVESGVEGLHQEIATVRERLNRLEGNIAALEAGMRRIDKFTLEAFRNIQEIEEQVRSHASPAAGGVEAAGRGRLPKEEAARLALDAGQRMRSQGKRITLAAVAREAGLKYGQIVYAFGNKEGFLSALAAGTEDGGRLVAEAQDPIGDSPLAPSPHAATGYEETATA